MSLVSEAAPVVDAFPPPPRPFTPRILRRAWAEPQVRFRWIFGLIVLIGALWFAISGMRGWFRDKSLIQLPTVLAKIKRANDDIHLGRPVPMGAAVLVELRRDEQPIESWGTLAGYESAKPPAIGEDIPIHVDPEDPNRWTARNEPPSLVVSLFPALICLFFVILAFIAAWMRRRSVLRIWRDAPAVPAVAVEWQHNALAPRSFSAKCSLAEPTQDRTLFQVIVPAAAAQRSKAADGQLIVLVPEHGQRMAADWFA